MNAFFGISREGEAYSMDVWVYPTLYSVIRVTY